MAQEFNVDWNADRCSQPSVYSTCNQKNEKNTDVKQVTVLTLLIVTTLLSDHKHQQSPCEATISHCHTDIMFCYMWKHTIHPLLSIVYSTNHFQHRLQNCINNLIRPTRHWCLLFLAVYASKKTYRDITCTFWDCTSWFSPHNCNSSWSTDLCLSKLLVACSAQSWTSFWHTLVSHRRIY